MTIEEFNNTGFTGGMKAVYKGEEYDIVSVDFEEALIAIDETGDEGNPCWKRCENIQSIAFKIQETNKPETIEKYLSVLQGLFSILKYTETLLLDKYCADNEISMEIPNVLKKWGILQKIENPEGDEKWRWNTKEPDRIMAGELVRRLRFEDNPIVNIKKQESTSPPQGAINSFSLLFGFEQLAFYSEREYVFLVKSKRTAAIMSLFMPECLWLATGSKNGFKIDMLKGLKDIKVTAFPDKGEYFDWKAKADEINALGYNIKVSGILENKKSYPDGTDVSDIAIDELSDKTVVDGRPSKAMFNWEKIVKHKNYEKQKGVIEPSNNS